MSDNGYAARCVQAATEQGLDPVTERLHLESLHYYVEQTGGFTMVVTVPTEEGVYGVTSDGERSWLVVFYPGESWNEGGEHLVEDVHPEQSLDDVVQLIKGEKQ